MKLFLVCGVLLGTVALSAWAVSTATPNFAGTWVLDKSRSTGLPLPLQNVESYRMIVTQDEKQLSVENKIVGGTRERGVGPGGEVQSGPYGTGYPGGGHRGMGGYGGGIGGRSRAGTGGWPGGTARSRRGSTRAGSGMPLPKAVYRLDGEDTLVETSGPMPGTATLRARWKDEGKALELTTIRSLNSQGSEVNLMTTERWNLQEDGSALKVERTTDTPRGTRKSELIFIKQGGEDEPKSVR